MSHAQLSPRLEIHDPIGDLDEVVALQGQLLGDCEHLTLAQLGLGLLVAEEAGTGSYRLADLMQATASDPDEIDRGIDALVARFHMRRLNGHAVALVLHPRGRGRRS
jgi:hypothetical protein